MRLAPLRLRTRTKRHWKTARSYTLEIGWCALRAGEAALELLPRRDFRFKITGFPARIAEALAMFNKLRSAYVEARENHMRTYQEVKDRHWNIAKERARVGSAYDTMAEARLALVDYAGKEHVSALDAMLVATEKYQEVCC
jgi:hypothetical protein